MAQEAAARHHRPAERAPRQLKVLVTGPFSAGKTTLINTISEIAVVGTERPVTSENARKGKTETTVALDFGRITFGGDLALHLFGTPGQARFEVMWEILSEGMLGFVLLVDGSDAGSVADATKMLAKFRTYSHVPFVIAVSHLDVTEMQPAEAIRKVRGELAVGGEVRVLACDPRDKNQVIRVLHALLHEVLEELQEAAEANG